MSTPRSRRRSRLSDTSNPSLVVNAFDADVTGSAKGRVDAETQGSHSKDVGRNGDVENTLHEAQSSRSRRRSRLSRAIHQRHAPNDLDAHVDTIGTEAPGNAKKATVRNDVVDTGTAATITLYQKGANSRRVTRNLKWPSLPDDRKLGNTASHRHPFQGRTTQKTIQEIPEHEALEEQKKLTEGKAEESLNRDCQSRKESDSESYAELIRVSLSDELRIIREGLKETANKTYVQYFDTIRRKDVENEAISQLLVEEKHRRSFDKCMQQLANSRGDKRVQFATMKESLEDEISRKDAQLQSISSELLEEKQKRLMAKCHVEMCDRRRRIEVRKLSEIVAQETFKRKELENKLTSLLPEIKILKSLVDLNGGTPKVDRDFEINLPQQRHQDLSSQLERTSQLLVHTKAHLFDVVDIYQQTNNKVNDLEAAILKARTIARDLFDRGSKVLERKLETRPNTSDNSDYDPFDLPGKAFLKFTQNATWLAGLLASELPSTPWGGPSRPQAQGSQQDEHAHYDPLGLYTTKKGQREKGDTRETRERESRRLERNSNYQKKVPVSARSSGLELKRQKPQVFRDDSVILAGSKVSR